MAGGRVRTRGGGRGRVAVVHACRWTRGFVLIVH